MIDIKYKRRLLATMMVGIAMVTGAALLVSLDADDKPAITTNPPPANDAPEEDPVEPTADSEALPTAPDEGQDDGGDEDPELPGNDPEDQGKGHGLQTAIQAHIEAMEKTEMKGKSTPEGLHNSLQLLTEMYAGVVAGEKAAGNARDH